ncbi:MAG: diaminopimelate decarboxylase [Epsilonproteobacteria bacterium]|nr:diaminopimelate decarboxylase [Campylobacterota bacterium]
MDFKEAAQKFGTPLYIYDFDAIKRNFFALREAFGGQKLLIAYAIKANSNLSLIKELAKLGAGADCVSIGEIKRALIAGVEPYKIIFSGVGKRDDEIREALLKNILFINVESEAELLHIEQIAKELDIEARISVRVNPNVNPKTHPYISTGLSENKFGVDIESAKRLYIHAKNSPYLNPIGVHFHIGSQLIDLAPIKESALIVADLVKSLLAIGVEIRFFDVGGGIGVQYEDEKTIDLNEYARAIKSAIKGMDLTVILEPGRFLVANSGYFVTKVLYEKENQGKRFVIVDGAMNDLIRPSLYSASHKITFIGEDSPNKTKADIVGPICESGDFLAKDVLLPPTKSGDLIVIHSAGAYGFTMASNYNSRLRAAEVAYEDGKFKLIRKRESFDDLIANEVEFLEE